MNFLNVGRKIGELEGLISKIDCGTLVTKKNQTNQCIKLRALKLLEELQNEVENNS
ncbi:hypothetical protein [Clostridium paraputrificum]|uniref:hypothetical protein n=1 Tax=Clostridium paraputrificum TaxID=29363 RepID=UPI0006C00E39|nr:hypothetical protein [Clostridium paraputrificum]CUO85017.1 Uncharacterised protein [Clostridium paraputrificum]